MFFISFLNVKFDWLFGYHVMNRRLSDNHQQETEIVH